MADAELPHAAMTLAGWGRTTAGESAVYRVERLSELRRLLARGGVPLIARGNGRSYGDQAVNTGGAVALTTRLDRILEFEPESGRVTCEAGVTFNDLIATFLPRGHLVPASPGTGFTTIGGALANDVHGKNHEHDGSFGDHVISFRLLTADGELHDVTDPQDPLFRATLGGGGLTGIVTDVTFRMETAPSSWMRVSERRIADLDAFLAAFESTGEARFSVGWIDLLAGGRELGRGILETADLAADIDRPLPRRRPRRMPVDLPGFVLNRRAVRLFNAAYLRRVPAAGRERLRPVPDFLYPLDAIRDWNRMYGKHGFRQFQCVLPRAEAATGLPLLIAAISGFPSASFLAVIKAMGQSGKGYLSFPMPGITLAFDVPDRPGCAELFGELERITLDHGGRVYLAKDSCLSPDSLAKMYPELPAFRSVLEDIDPQGRFASDMARRLGLAAGKA
jgi:decaprenylphospho-beta-D-ribofuranose 2-oxidase